MLGQWTYDAYGQCLSAQDFLGTPSMHLGHKGLFFDRLDEIAPEPGAADDPVRLIPYAHNLTHVRNRTYAPQLGRWMQRDPNATALTLAEASSYHGRGMTALAVAGFTPDDLYGDGYNLYEYLGSNPWMRSDPSGLEWDPIAYFDQIIDEMMGERVAFLERVGEGVKAAATQAAHFASYLPIPILPTVADLFLLATGQMGMEEFLAGAAMGLIPGGKICKAFAHVGAAVARVAKAAFQVAWKYAKQGAKWLWRNSPYGMTFNAIKKWLKRGCGCFTHDTQVWTSRGLIPIAEVDVGDAVLARDESTGEFSLRAVTRKFVRAAAPIVVLTLASAMDGAHIELETTEEHPFLVEARQTEGPAGWVRADSLKPGDSITTARGFAIVRAVQFTNRLEPVYNFEVEGLHNYAVAEDGVVVHNGGPCGIPIRLRLGTAIPNYRLKYKPSRRGDPPMGEDGFGIELHHEGQDANGAIHELTRTEHRLGDNFSANHTNTGQLPSGIDRAEWDRLRYEYWAEQWDVGRFSGLPAKP